VDVNKYYHGFSNRILWPLFHEIDVPPIFHRTDYWQSYKKVNEKFAENIPTGKKQLLWIHDYHLALVPKILREKDLESIITFFWHIPWPSTDRYIRCPWRTEIVEGLISSDIIGFHLDDYIENFLKSVEVCTNNDVKVNHDNGKITQGKKTTIVKSYPIGVDFKKFEQMANNPTLNPDELYTGKILILGVERLDYTKGLIEKLRGIETFFEKHKKEYKGNIQFVQIASPSRQKVKEYRDITKEVKKITERINTNFRIGKWKPIELINKYREQNILADYYRRADAFLVLPHHDGMNLTTKEFVASQVEKKGVLVLSQFAGAARELGKYSIVVNPFNKEEVADAIYEATIMSKREKGEKMEKMRKYVRANDIYKWVKEIMGDAITLYKK